MPEFNYTWQFDTQAPPEAMWTRMADTNRFNRDTGIPALNGRVIEQRGDERHLGFRYFGLVNVEWDEEPFEWVRPYRFGVVRRYTGSPLKEVHIRVELQPRADGGTHLIYKARVVPRNLIGTLATPLQIGLLTRRGIARAVNKYDMELTGRAPALSKTNPSALTPGARPRLDAARQNLSSRNFSRKLIDKLFESIEYADDISLARMRPYVLADEWKVPRREVLELCLHATRLGILDLEWDLLCPLCRGASNTAETLGDVQKQVHCEACNIDYEVNFERSVELSFHPNPSVRQVDTRVYCVGGPQVTPHIFAQHHLPPRTQATISIPLEGGRYRLRTPQKRGGQFLFAEPEGLPELTLRATEDNWNEDEPRMNLQPHLIFENATPQDQLFILERWAWSDQSVTAADVTALQTFRDLFANEALRSGEQFSVGGLTLVFTDLKRSTQLYRQIGDAPAFGRVLNHFEIIRSAVDKEEGAVVKTMGDAVMAVFRRPVNAIRAMQAAQHVLSDPPENLSPLALKVGIHSGTCIAVNLNNRLDYFGTTVNIAARIAGLSSGRGILVSDAVWNDPEVGKWIGCQPGFHSEPFKATLRGYEEPFTLWRIEPNEDAETLPQMELAN